MTMKKKQIICSNGTTKGSNNKQTSTTTMLVYVCEMCAWTKSTAAIWQVYIDTIIIIIISQKPKRHRYKSRPFDQGKKTFTLDFRIMIPSRNLLLLLLCLFVSSVRFSSSDVLLCQWWWWRERVVGGLSSDFPTGTGKKTKKQHKTGMSFFFFFWSIGAWSMRDILVVATQVFCWNHHHIPLPPFPPPLFFLHTNKTPRSIKYRSLGNCFRLSSFLLNFLVLSFRVCVCVFSVYVCAFVVNM